MKNSTLLLVWYCLFTITRELSDIYTFLTTGFQANLTSHMEYFFIVGLTQLFMILLIKKVID